MAKLPLVPFKMPISLSRPLYELHGIGNALKMLFGLLFAARCFGIFKIERLNHTIKENNYENRSHGKSLLLIAAVPKDEIHVTALWSELECLTMHMDQIIIAAPNVDWSKQILDRILLKAKSAIPDAPPIDVYYFDNNRYDSGLWCDALGLLRNISKFRKIDPELTFMINDSVFILRHFDGLREMMLGDNKIQLVSMNGAGKGTKRYWVER